MTPLRVERAAPAPAPARGYDAVQSVERAFQLFELLVQHRSLKLGALADAVGVHKSTAFRLLQTLMKLGYVEKEPGGGAYQLGLKAIETGARALRSWPVHEAARPVMDGLAATLGETVNLALVDGIEMVYVVTVDTENALRMQLNVGRRAPVHCTAVGKAVLAFRPDVFARLAGRPLARLTEKTLVDLGALDAHLAEVRRLGYAVDDEEQEVGARCVAAPVRDAGGRVIGALGISAPAARLKPERIREVGPDLVRAAAVISTRLGWCE